MCLAYARVPQDDPYGAARLLLEAGADPDAGVLLDGEVPPFTVLTGCFGEGEQGPGRQPRHPQGEALAALLLDHGADPNDGQTLYNRMFGRDDSHLRVLLAARSRPRRRRGLASAPGGAAGRPRDADGRPAGGLGAGARPDRPADAAGGVRVRRRDARRRSVALARARSRSRRSRPPAPRTGVRARGRGLGGADLDAKVHGRTLLHHAAWIGDVELVRALLEGGADPRSSTTTTARRRSAGPSGAYAAGRPRLLGPVTREV